MECLPATMSDYIKAVANSVQTSIDMPAVAGLITLAICLQKKFLVITSYSIHYTKLYEYRAFSFSRWSNYYTKKA